MEYIDRYFKEISGSYFLFGPRGTGKTLWLRHTHPQSSRIDLLDSDTYREYSARPERLVDFISALKGRTDTVIIDEIQKVPNLLTEVHQQLSHENSPRFILTGSSARKLKREGVDLLAGRAAVLKMFPFMASELGEKFNLVSALRWGMLPVVLASEDQNAALSAYLAVYMKEEIQQEGLVRNIGHFNRFLETISFSHGNVLNLAQIARECQISRSTVEGYLSILEDLLLSFQLPVFSRRAARKLVTHQKFYFFDSGVYNKLRPRGPLDSNSEIGGAALEGLVAQHLRSWISYSRNDCQLYYWRTKAGSEVDFVIYGPDNFIAIEVKSSTRVERRDVRSLKAFREDYSEAQTLLLYGGREKLKINGVLCLPCEGFLRNLTPSQKIHIL